ncbi:hypothetical protein GGS23DRAFT_595579 [Durotheca rogersii]|uniref:uncharacterized protein n=1 Tax=Durotheca rogersii TaxID=419775 RepID=UPI00221F0215|nr:uncharacterized protein GGS23DRAFT_595579 [Durotheca rogersii]KAI5864886.1 hypothetical protein GGS23DRAFT_595579 [Durotheca rogersii]
MGDFGNPFATPPSHYGNTLVDNATTMDKINRLCLVCNFLDRLPIDLSVSHDVPVDTPDLASAISTLQLDLPINVSMMRGPSRSRDEQHQQQWRLPLRFMQKIDACVQKLLRCSRTDMSVALRDWVAGSPQPSLVRDTGLGVLGAMEQNNVPSRFDELLCAMIVQHAVFEIDHIESLSSQSAFIGWATLTPEIQDNAELFARLVRDDHQLSASVDARQAGSVPPTPSSSAVMGAGGGGLPASFPSYPTSVADADLSSDTPRYAQPAYSPNTNEWPLSPNGDFSPGWLPYYGTPGPFPPAGFVAHPAVANASSFVAPQQLQADFDPFYLLMQPTNVAQYSVQVNRTAVRQSPAFGIFVGFIEAFSRCDLAHIFSHNDANPLVPPQDYPPPMAPSLSRDGWYRFPPLDTSVLVQLETACGGAVEQAIVSTARSLVESGRIHSFWDAARYMCYLSANLLPSINSYRSFVRVVLRANSPNRLPTESAQGLKQYAEELARNFRGAFCPAHLLRPRRPSHMPLGEPSGDRRHPLAPYTALSSLPTTHSRSLTDTSTVISTLSRTAATTLSENSVPSRQCSDCDKSFHGKHASSHLSRHRREHRGPLSTACPLCGKPFPHQRTDNIRSHCWNVHGQALPRSGKAFWASQKARRSDRPNE